MNNPTLRAVKPYQIPKSATLDFDYPLRSPQTGKTARHVGTVTGDPLSVAQQGCDMIEHMTLDLCAVTTDADTLRKIKDESRSAQLAILSNEFMILHYHDAKFDYSESAPTSTDFYALVANMRAAVDRIVDMYTVVDVTGEFADNMCLVGYTLASFPTSESGQHVRDNLCPVVDALKRLIDGLQTAAVDKQFMTDTRSKAHYAEWRDLLATLAADADTLIPVTLAAAYDDDDRYP